MSAEPGPSSPWWLRLLELGALGLVLFFVVRYLWIQFGQIDFSGLEFDPWRLGLAQAGLTAVGLLTALPVAGLYRALGHPLSARSALALGSLPSLGKFVPGKVHAALGLAWLAHRLHGIPARVSLTVAALLLVQGVAITLIASGLMAPWTRLAPGWMALLAAGALVGVGMVHPALCLLPISFLLRWLKRPPLAEEPIGWRAVAMPVLVTLIQRLSAAGLFVLLASGLIDIPAGHQVYLGLAYILAVVIGFVALFAPGGIGVQDGALLLLLSPVLPPDQAALLTVAARIWQTLRVLLCALIGGAFLVGRREQPPDEPAQ